MNWNKLGRVYVPDGSLWWARSHAMIPTPTVLSDDVVRVFFTSCDKDGVGRIGFVDLSAKDPSKVINIGTEPVLGIGEPGTFDENGALVCSVVSLANGGTYLYYAGFELGQKIRYRLLTGVAVQEAGDTVFRRVQRVPVLERSDSELYFRCGPHVIREKAGFRMWYVAGSSWAEVGGTAKPVYDIRHIESSDGVHWPDSGRPCIRVEYLNEHGFGRPYVLRDGNLFRMFYSIRRRDVQSYRLGYAESIDGVNWSRKDSALGLDVSGTGWDSEMICYSAVMKLHGQIFMLYNGNNFGETGFGLAVLEQ